MCLEALEGRWNVLFVSDAIAAHVERADMVGKTTKHIFGDGAASEKIADIICESFDAT